jgi:hypothetical protein
VLRLLELELIKAGVSSCAAGMPVGLEFYQVRLSDIARLLIRLTSCAPVCMFAVGSQIFSRKRFSGSAVSPSSPEIQI